ncbi:MAG: hypothetical protein R3D85_10625 [Paracoccaceae bacterium]
MTEFSPMPTRPPPTRFACHRLGYAGRHALYRRLFRAGRLLGRRLSSEGFTAYELQQFAAVFDLIETLTNLTINIATDSTEAEFVVILDTNEINGAFLGYFNPPGEDNQGVGVFDGNGWDREAGGNLEQGGDGWYTIVHEFMHGAWPGAPARYRRHLDRDGRCDRRLRQLWHL